MTVLTATNLTYPQAYELAFAIRTADSADYVPATDTWTYTFTPDLTTAEQTAFADRVAAYHTRDVELSVAEYQAIKADIAGLRTYQAIASPTLAQTVSAVKAQSRILRALLRDG